MYKPPTSTEPEAVADPPMTPSPEPPYTTRCALIEQLGLRGAVIAGGLGLIEGSLRCHLAGHLSSHASPAGPGHADQADNCVSLYPSSGVQRHTITGVVKAVAPDTGSLWNDAGYFPMRLYLLIAR